MRLVICTKAEAAERNLPAYFKWPEYHLVCVRYLDKGDVVKLSGLEGTYDYALPQNWVDRQDDPQKAVAENVWWYGPDSHIFGEPVNVEQKVRDMGAGIFEKAFKAQDV